MREREREKRERGRDNQTDNSTLCGGIIVIIISRKEAEKAVDPGRHWWGLHSSLVMVSTTFP